MPKIDYAKVMRENAALKSENAAIRVENETLKARPSSTYELPLSGSFTTANGVNTLTVAFVLREPAVVRGKKESAKQGTRCVFAQSRGGQPIGMDAVSSREFARTYGFSELRLIGNIGTK